MSPIITVENLSKKYTTYKRGSGFKESVKSFFHREKVFVDAVRDVSFTVQEGDIVGILGPNGAGKSTTIKMLTGTLFPSEGSIRVMEYIPYRNRAAYVKHMGAVFGQKSQLIFDIPPLDSFRMNRAIYGIPEESYTQRLNMLIGLLDLEDKIMRPTRVLSLGERMKCEFIMAMLHDPRIVFLDEPTIGLDVIAKQNIREFIKEMNRKGTTFILTTHDLEDVEQLARNVIIINNGEKVFDHPIEDLRRTLGNKKIVELTLTRQVNLEKDEEGYSLGIEGTKITDMGKGLTITVEVDVDTIPMNRFITRLTEILAFSDISIKELPMDKIITHIYRKDP